jgi:hypothetical protein
MQVVGDLLNVSGIGRGRLQIRWVSAAEGQLFADYVTEISKLIEDLGPLDHDQFGVPLAAAEQTLGSPRIRWLTGLTRQVTEHRNVYNEKIEENHFKKLLQEASEQEYQKALIIQTLREGPQSVGGISEKTGLPVYAVSLRLNELEKHGHAELCDYDGRTPRFIALSV